MVKNLFLKIKLSVKSPTAIFRNNICFIINVYNFTHYQRLKYTLLKFYYERKLFIKKLVILKYLELKQTSVNGFVKPLTYLIYIIFFKTYKIKIPIRLIFTC